MIIICFLCWSINALKIRLLFGSRYTPPCVQRVPGTYFLDELWVEGRKCHWYVCYAEHTHISFEQYEQYVVSIVNTRSFSYIGFFPSSRFLVFIFRLKTQFAEDLLTVISPFYNFWIKISNKILWELPHLMTWMGEAEIPLVL